MTVLLVGCSMTRGNHKLMGAKVGQFIGTNDPAINVLEGPDGWRVTDTRVQWDSYNLPVTENDL